MDEIDRKVCLYIIKYCIMGVIIMIVIVILWGKINFRLGVFVLGF